MRKDFTNLGNSRIRTFAFMGDKTYKDVKIDGKHRHEGCSKDKASKTRLALANNSFCPHDQLLNIRVANIVGRHS